MARTTTERSLSPRGSSFHHEGFRPASRLCLDLDLEQSRTRADAAEAMGYPAD